MEFDAEKLDYDKIGALMSKSKAITVKLRDKEDYLNWKAEISSILNNGLLGFVNGTYICPSSREPGSVLSENFKEWIRYDGFVKKCLVESCSELNPLYCLPDPLLVTSEQIWDYLQSLFDSPQGFVVEGESISIGDENRYTLVGHENSILLDDTIPLKSKLIPVRAAHSIIEEFAGEGEPKSIGDKDKYTLLKHDSSVILDDTTPLKSKLFPVRAADSVIEADNLRDGESVPVVYGLPKAVPARTARSVSERKKIVCDLVDNKLIELFDVVDGNDNENHGLSWSADGNLRVDISVFDDYSKTKKRLGRNFKSLNVDLDYYGFHCVYNDNFHAIYQHEVFKRGNRDALSLYVTNSGWLS